MHASHPFSQIHIDIVGKYTHAVKGDQSILAMIDQLTGSMKVMTIEEKMAETVSITFIHAVLCLWQTWNNIIRLWYTILQPGFLNCAMIVKVHINVVQQPFIGKVPVE